MLRYTNYDIVFQEIPDETTLAINISGCPHRCPGCHSPELWEDIGEELNLNILVKLVKKYSNITCICFMGGDNYPKELCSLAWQFSNRNFGKHEWMENIKLAWYSGGEFIPDKLYDNITGNPFTYIKLGPYIEELGPLNNPNTNQRMYKFNPFSSAWTIGKGWEDITYKFWKSEMK